MSTNEPPRRGSRKRWIILAAIVIVIAIVGTLAYVANSGSAPAPPAGPNVTVWDGLFCTNSGNCGYSPSAKSVAVGTSLTWTNTGSKYHSVTECASTDSSTACPNGKGANGSGSRAFDSNIQYSSGIVREQQFTYTFTSPGTFYYYCTVHPFMHGTVIVN